MISIDIFISANGISTKQSFFDQERKGDDSDLTYFSENQLMYVGENNQVNRLNKKKTQPPRNVLDSYNKLPIKTKKAPSFVYEEKYNRKTKIEKKLLPGWTCKNCQPWYDGLEFVEADKKNLINKCSKHRRKFQPPAATPDSFWEILPLSLSDEK